MQIKAVFFAIYRDIAGTDELEVHVPEGISVQDLVVHLRGQGGEWKTFPAEPAVAVNLQYTNLRTALSDGDEVAFIPPVSGG